MFLHIRFQYLHPYYCITSIKCASVHILIYTGLEIERVIGTRGKQIASRDLKRVTAWIGTLGTRDHRSIVKRVPGTQLDFVILKLQEKDAIKKQSDFNIKGSSHNILKYGVTKT